MASPSVSIRELQQNLKGIMARVERGESLEVTRWRRPVARLVPAAGAAKPERWPDLERRARTVFGGRKISPGGVKTVLEGRGER